MHVKMVQAFVKYQTRRVANEPKRWWRENKTYRKLKKEAKIQ